MKIYTGKNRNVDYALDYLKTKIECDGENISKEDTIVKKTILLEVKQQKAIINYLQRMIKSSNVINF